MVVYLPGGVALCLLPALLLGCWRLQRTLARRLPVAAARLGRVQPARADQLLWTARVHLIAVAPRPCPSKIPAAFLPHLPAAPPPNRSPLRPLRRPPRHHPLALRSARVGGLVLCAERSRYKRQHLEFAPAAACGGALVARHLGPVGGDDHRLRQARTAQRRAARHVDPTARTAAREREDSFLEGEASSLSDSISLRKPIRALCRGVGSGWQLVAGARSDVAGVDQYYPG